MVGPRADELSRTARVRFFFALDAARAALEFRLRTGCNMSDSTVKEGARRRQYAAKRLPRSREDQMIKSFAPWARCFPCRGRLVFAADRVLAQQPPAAPNKAGSASSRPAQSRNRRQESGRTAAADTGDRGTRCRSRSSSCRRLQNRDLVFGLADARSLRLGRQGTVFVSTDPDKVYAIVEKGVSARRRSSHRASTGRTGSLQGGTLYIAAAPKISKLEKDRGQY